MRERVKKLNMRTLDRGRLCHGLGRSCQELLGLTAYDIENMPDIEISDEITEKGGGHMVIKMMNTLIHTTCFRRGLRRGLAAALSLALVLPMFPDISAFAANTQLFPVKKLAAGEEFPHIEVEGNFVRDEFGFLTGYYEMGLRVRTPANGSFMGLGVVLKYDTSILTPVDWSETGVDVTIENQGYYNVQMPTQKLESISSATAHSGTPAAAPGGGSTPTDTTALMSFVVNSYKQMQFLPADPDDPDATTLAVVRFRVKSEVMENLSISKTASGDYQVKYGDEEVVDVNSLYERMSTVTPSIAVRVMDFATDNEIKESKESKKLDVHMALDYMAGYESAADGNIYTNEYYHIPAYDPTDSTTFVTGTAAQEVIGDKTTPYSFDQVPNTENNRIMAVDPTVVDTATAWGAGKYSYTSNLIVNTKPKYVVRDSDGNPVDNLISFPVVSKRSFTDRSNVLGNLTTIVYVDWDNTFLGTQVVPKNVDVRQLVSDHVAENFIYHDDSDNATHGANDLNTPLEAADPEAEVSSLKRADNYRGKYTANGPAAESTTDSTVVTNGGSYPLTNKLDYVFLKRPMTHTNAFDEDANPKPDPDDYPGGVTDSQYITDLAAYEAAYQAWYWGKTEWSQQVDDDGKPEWDVERPYAYGWAECTVDNYEDVWTTLGMGELGSTDAVDEPHAKGTTKGYSGANLGGYKAIPSTSIASVTYDGDAKFAFADLSKGFNKDTVFLKAIYEPGEGLETKANFYRMIQTPYYNKFNNMPASDGGAYSVQVAYERAMVTDDGKLCGVARMREPVARQDTTADLKWEESTTPNVKHDLANPNWSEAYTSKGKTTYTKLDVPNSEEITLEMSYSARQNKLDFFLRENYETNFVAAGARTITNALRDFAEYAADNYNYYTGDTSKVPTDYFAPTEYSDREGSYGFVLFGTLNYLMEQATKYANHDPEVDWSTFYNTVSYSLADANLKKSDGTSITEYDDIVAVMEVLEAAAQEAEGKKNDPDAADYWNKERQCAELTYHQLQWYMGYKDNPTGVLLDRATADDSDHMIEWCHLHAACAALLSGKPQNWPALVAKAAANDQTSIAKLTVEEIESKFHLRSDGDGNANWTSPTPTDFAQKVADGVQALIAMGIPQADVTWDQVQYYIDHGSVGTSATDMNDYGSEHYWWYDGEKVVDFDDVKLAADAAHEFPVLSTLTLPDGRPVAERMAKLNQVRDSFPTDANAPGADWIKFTENLTAGEDPADASKVVSFTDFDTFADKLIEAVHALDVTTVPAMTWHEVQYYILHGSAGGATNTEYDTYWWHNGGVHITDLRSLLKAAQKGGDAWSSVDFTVFNGLNLHLAKDLKGTAISSADFTTIKGYLGTYATPSLNLDAITDSNLWDIVQSLIINSGTVDDAMRDAEKGYYWWKDGSAAPADHIAFTPTGSDNEAKAKNMAKLLSEAYFKINFNGYPSSEWDNLAATDLATGRLVRSFTGSETAFTALGQLTAADVSTVISKVESLFKTANGGTGNLTYSPSPIYEIPYTPIDWTALQKEITGDPATNPEYWWMKLDTKANPPEQDFADLNAGIQDYLDGNGDTALKAAFTVEKLANMGFTLDGANPVDQGTVDAINGDWATIIAMSQSMGGFVSTPMKWNQIQFLFVSPMMTGGAYATLDATSADMYLPMLGTFTPPDWVTAGGYSLTPMMAMSMLSPKRQLEQQAGEIKEMLAYLTEALEDEALLAQLKSDSDYMDSLAALAGLLGYDLTAKPADKTYQVGQDTTLRDVTSQEQKGTEDEQKQPEKSSSTYQVQADTTTTTIEEKSASASNGASAEEKNTSTKSASTEKSAAAEKNVTTTVDNTADAAANTRKTTNEDETSPAVNAAGQQAVFTVPDTGGGGQGEAAAQGAALAADPPDTATDPPGTTTDPPGTETGSPPGGELPQIIGIVKIEGLEKLTKGVYVA